MLFTAEPGGCISPHQSTTRMKARKKLFKILIVPMNKSGWGIILCRPTYFSTIRSFIVCDQKVNSPIHSIHSSTLIQILRDSGFYLSHCGKLQIDDVKLSIISFYSAKGAGGGINFFDNGETFVSRPTKDVAPSDDSMRHQTNSYAAALKTSRDIKLQASQFTGKLSLDLHSDQRTKIPGLFLSSKLF